MLYLEIDFDKCNECNCCEKILSGFRSKYKGELLISAHRYKNSESVRQSCLFVINICDKKAITLRGNKS